MVSDSKIFFTAFLLILMANALAMVVAGAPKVDRTIGLGKYYEDKICLLLADAARSIRSAASR